MQIVWGNSLVRQRKIKEKEPEGEKKYNQSEQESGQNNLPRVHLGKQIQMPIHSAQELRGKE